MPSKLIRNYLPEFFALGWKRKKPSMVTVNLTRRCNQHCIYCEIGSELADDSTGSLTPGDVKWIVDQMALHRIKRLSLCGGEPFMFDGLIELVTYAAGKGVRCSITSNGMTIHRLSENELKALKAAKAEINISIDSFEAEIQAHTRGVASALSNALNSVATLQHHKIPLTVLTVISVHNYDKLLSFVEQAHNRGIRQVLFQPVITASNYPERPVLEDKKWLNPGLGELKVLMSELKKIPAFERSHPISTNVYRIYPWIAMYLKNVHQPNGGWFWEPLLEAFFCREIYAIIDISYDGGIQPCGLAQAGIFINSNSEKGLIDLWQEATLPIKEEVGQGRFYDICNACCHHFSRNMLASLARYPLKNRKALAAMLPAMFSRVMWRVIKKIR